MFSAACLHSAHEECNTFSPDGSCICHCHLQVLKGPKVRKANDLIRSSSNPWLGKFRQDMILKLIGPAYTARDAVDYANQVIELLEG